MQLRFRIIPTAVVVLAGWLLVGAGGDSSGGQGKADFWSDLARPGHKRFVAALERGKKLFESASRMVASSQQAQALWRRTLQDALAAFREATQASPRAADGQFWLGRTLYELGQMKESIAAFERVRKLDPRHGEDYIISFNLGIAHSKLGQFGVAVREYDRAERILARQQQANSTTRAARATLHGNAAEALMALGRLDEAIQRYREALDLQPGYVLAWWGLAVALDRDEQVSKAMAAVQRVIAYDQGMKKLVEPGVFFIPQGDIHYYYGLGYLAQGKVEQSRGAWERFISDLPDSPWRHRAREHLAQLGQHAGRGTAGKRLAPAPSGRRLATASSARDRASVRYRLRGHMHSVRRCFQNELRARSDLSGRMRVELVIAASGKVARAKVLSSTLSRPALRACVLGVLRRATFSRTGSGNPVKLVVPFEFKPN